MNTKNQTNLIVGLIGKYERLKKKKKEKKKEKRNFPGLYAYQNVVLYTYLLHKPTGGLAVEWRFGDRHMGRLVLGRPGPVTHKEERRKKREKREKEEKKKEGERKEKEKKKREEREEDLRPIWTGYSVFRLCASLYTRPFI